LNLLNSYINNFYIRVVKHSEKELYLAKYNSMAIDWNEKHNRLARGIVLNSEGTIVTKPYEKFFNEGELVPYELLTQKQLDNLWHDPGINKVVMDKLDGSLINVTKYEGDLLITSSGSFNSDQSKLAGSLLTDIGKFEKLLNKLKEKQTAMFELIGPDNRIVLDYSENDLILHGVSETIQESNHTRIVEYTIEEIETFNKHLGFETPEVYDLNRKQIYQSMNKDIDIEGYVVQFEHNNKVLGRIKYKTLDYIEKHHALTGDPKSKRAIKGIQEAYMGGYIDDFLAYYQGYDASEYVDTIQEVLHTNREFDELVAKQKEVSKTMADYEDRKRYAIHTDDSDYIKGLTFGILDNKDLTNQRNNFVLEKMTERG